MISSGIACPWGAPAPGLISRSVPAGDFFAPTCCGSVFSMAARLLHRLAQCLFRAHPPCQTARGETAGAVPAMNAAPSLASSSIRMTSRSICARARRRVPPAGPAGRGDPCGRWFRRATGRSSPNGPAPRPAAPPRLAKKRGLSAAPASSTRPSPPPPAITWSSLMATPCHIPNLSPTTARSPGPDFLSRAIAPWWNKSRRWFGLQTLAADRRRAFWQGQLHGWKNAWRWPFPCHPQTSFARHSRLQPRHRPCRPRPRQRL